MIKIKLIVITFLGTLTLQAQSNEKIEEEKSKTSMQIAAKKYGAASGSSLTQSPRIRPDNKLYYIQGNIHQADNEPRFMARLANSLESELAHFMMTGQMMPESTNYFEVILPIQLQKSYFDHAKINGGFDLIGEYIDNVDYTTVFGENKMAPVFKAVYFRLWSDPENKSSASTEQTTENSQETHPKDKAGTTTFENCIESANGIMPSMIECSNTELEKQDKRLNFNYKQAMKVAYDKKLLRNIQRQWIKDRDKKCVLEADSGQAGMLNHVECLRQFTEQRADELEFLARKR